MFKKWRRIKEASERIGLSTRTLYREMAEGRLPYIVYRNRRLLTDEDIDRLVRGGS